ncbi:Hypothetical_protein [Hexamita inflata]|uniref:Hypothetical_protein n=1 Tax=Hexamita inflata TaxID=28002 RepID=A0AA86UZS2_9EUKA|nr:Hypothetical protein HINF_LOCUS58277 [Hexamita inflata]
MGLNFRRNKVSPYCSIRLLKRMLVWPDTLFDFQFIHSLVLRTPFQPRILTIQKQQQQLIYLIELSLYLRALVSSNSLRLQKSSYVKLSKSKIVKALETGMIHHFQETLRLRFKFFIVVTEEFPLCFAVFRQYDYFIENEHFIE